MKMMGDWNWKGESEWMSLRALGYAILPSPSAAALLLINNIAGRENAGKDRPRQLKAAGKEFYNFVVGRKWRRVESRGRWRHNENAVCVSVRRKS